MIVVCLDLEGVLVPEVWINVAEREGIEALRLTTRDIPDYDELMGHRLRVLEEHNLTIGHIQAAIDTLSPLEGALAFLDGLREQYQVIILSDTFYQFAEPLMRQLAWPTLFCHDLDVDSGGRIAGYRLRQADQKRQAVRALHDLNFKVVAAGDSYNDTSMLGEADRGILFCPPDNVIREFPQFPVTRDYAALRTEIDTAASAIQ